LSRRRRSSHRLTPLVSDGDLKEGYYIRKAFWLLNSNETSITNIHFKNKNVLNRYQLLKKKVLLLKPVFKILPIKDKSKGYFPERLLKYFSNKYYSPVLS